MRTKLATIATVVGLLGLTSTGLTSTAFAQGMAPAVLPMQGFLTDGSGAPIDGDVDLTIIIYDGQTSTTELYGETQTVMVDGGSFTAYVGEGTPTGGAFDLAIFRDNADTWVGIAIDAGTELPRFQLGSVPYAGFAQYSAAAGNAVQLGGMPAANYAIAADSQARVTGTCPSGEAIVGINVDGTVSCASVGSSISHTCPTDEAVTAIAGDGTVTCAPVGDISSVGSGVGLTGGGTSGSVTLSIAPNGVTGAQIANGSVGVVDLQTGALGRSGEVSMNGTIAGTGSPEQLDAVDVTVPGPGTLLVIAGGDYYQNCDTSTTTSRFCTGGVGLCTSSASSSSCGLSWRRVDYEDPDTGTSLNAERVMHIMRFLPVSGAGTTRFYLNAQSPSGVSSNWSGYFLAVYQPGSALSLINR